MFVRALLPLLCALAMLATPSRAAAPLETIAGQYLGKVRSVLRPFDSSAGPPSVASDLIGFDLSQDGLEVQGGIVMFIDGEPLTTFEAFGNAGNGIFQLITLDGESLLVLTGTMKGEPGKRRIKGRGTTHSSFGLGEVKFSAKEIPPEAE